MVIPFASRATNRIARKTPSLKGCVKTQLCCVSRYGQIERSLWHAPWHRRPGYDLRCASCDLLDFPGNAAHVRLVQGFLNTLILDQKESPWVKN